MLTSPSFVVCCAVIVCLLTCAPVCPCPFAYARLRLFAFTCVPACMYFACVPPTFPDVSSYGPEGRGATVLGEALLHELEELPIFTLDMASLIADPVSRCVGSLQPRA